MVVRVYKERRRVKHPGGTWRGESEGKRRFSASASQVSSTQRSAGAVGGGRSCARWIANGASAGTASVCAGHSDGSGRTMSWQREKTRRSADILCDGA